MDKKKRFSFALAAYALLGLLIWTTMSDIPVRVFGGQVSIRGLTLAIIAFFAVRTLLNWRADQIRAQEQDEEFGENG
jgi:hypothetical protein